MVSLPQARSAAERRKIRRARMPRHATERDTADIAAIFAEAFAIYLPRLGPAAIPDAATLPQRIQARQVHVVDGELDPRRAPKRGFGSRSWARPVRWFAKPTVRPVAGARAAAQAAPPKEPEGPVATVTLAQRGRTLVISDLAVLPRHQHRGIGRNLLMFAEMTAYRQGLSRLEVTNSAAMWETQALYARMGFEELDSFDADDIEYVQLFKRLGPDRRRRS
ncbi:GNAT family N-acetyltransferase [Fodinicurvata sp. EGI_FJ10296]|uniref:GNAT family N-acetyltransferase n=1 Tax=Fodinicurvata sp. EGI_FJ10296 TaxID=3231908 RepID=UPI003452C9A9